MTSPSAKASYDALIEKFNDIKCDLMELKGGQKILEKSYQEFREAYSGERVAVKLRIDAAHTRIDELKERVSDLEKAIQPLVTWGKIAAFIASVLGVSIIGLIWSILTHQIILVVP